MHRIACWLVVFFALSAPAAAQESPDFAALGNRLTQAFNAGDMAGVAAVYAPDAILLPPGAGILQGREQIQAVFASAAEQVAELHLQPLDLRQLGPGAVREIGAIVVITRSDPPQTIEGKNVLIWELIGGEWLITSDIWNFNQ